MKKCIKCNKQKSLEDFGKDNSKNGVNGLHKKCKQCITEYRQINRLDYNKNYMIKLRSENKDGVNKRKRMYYIKMDISKKLYQQCKNRAIRKNIEFTININDIIIPNKCPYLNTEFIVGVKNNYEYTHSLDRIDNSKGYIPGNVEVVTKKANSMKNGATKEELILFAKNILKKFN